MGSISCTISTAYVIKYKPQDEPSYCCCTTSIPCNILLHQWPFKIALHDSWFHYLTSVLLNHIWYNNFGEGLYKQEHNDFFSHIYCKKDVWHFYFALYNKPHAKTLFCSIYNTTKCPWLHLNVHLPTIHLDVSIHLCASISINNFSIHHVPLDSSGFNPSDSIWSRLSLSLLSLSSHFLFFSFSIPFKMSSSTICFSFYVVPVIAATKALFNSNLSFFNFNKVSRAFLFFSKKGFSKGLSLLLLESPLD